MAKPPLQKTRHRRDWKWWTRWSVRAVVVLFIFGAFIVGFDGMFYYPSRNMPYTPRDFGLPYEDVTFRSTDGVKLHGWFLPAEGPAKATVVHYHGNAENISNHVAAVTWLPPAGYNVLVFDYRGYGRSEGRVTRAGTIRDGHAALNYVLSRPDVDPRRVFAFGQSLGGAVATVVAAERHELCAVVLDSTFSSYRHIASLHLRKVLFFKWPAELIARLGLSDDYEPLDCVSRISPRPLLVIASKQDQICFAELGRELFAAAAEPKEFILLERGGHLEAVADNEEGVQARILRFLESAGSSP